MKKFLTLATFLANLTGAWFAAGQALKKPVGAIPQAPSGPPVVRAFISTAQKIERMIKFNARTLPCNIVTLRTPLDGQVDTLLIKKGDALSIKQVTATIVGGTQAEEPLKTPIAGRVQDIYAPAGTFVLAGDPIATVVQCDPLLAVGAVKEADILHLKAGMLATVKVGAQTPIAGAITYLACAADPATGEFAVEVAIPNPEEKLPAGLSATVTILYETDSGHWVSPALVYLNKEKILCIQAVDDKRIIIEYPVKVAQSTEQGLCVTGLPETLRLISIGQNGLTPGSPVVIVNDEH